MASVGRPLKFENAEQIRKAGYEYFDQCKESESPITITGLCMALGTFRVTLLQYASGKHDDVDPEFVNTIKELKQVCENYAESRLFTTTPTGAIFALKNYDWSDRVQNEVSGPGGAPIESKVTIEFVRTKGINASEG
jgi:hypothetical protein